MNAKNYLSQVFRLDQRINSGFEVHQKAADILNGKKIDPTFYPVIYGIKESDNWSDEKNWYKANPSLDQTIAH